MTTLDEWVTAVCAELNLDPAQAEVPLILELARDVAHNVVRAGAPVTAYLLGLAVGQGVDLIDASARLTTLADTWGEPVPPAP
ncbi:MAG TPA: DUF6457 domain-containing protein [Micromonosporaceae bacterium]|nr:DUF6457 domain-containing protein [Micromonosporaceae bacterium]